jgi:hypothetical protein
MKTGTGLDLDLPYHDGREAHRADNEPLGELVHAPRSTFPKEPTFGKIESQGAPKM